MRYKDFVKFAESEAAKVIDCVNPELISQEFLPDLDKIAMDETKDILNLSKQDTPGNISSSLANAPANMSPLGEKMVEKIASELTELTLRSSIQEVNDPDYKYLLKEAGITPPSEPDHKFHELLIGSSVKTGSDGSLSFEKEAKVTALTKSQQKLLKKVTKEMPGLVGWGKKGRYAAAAVPVVGGAAYLKGRSTGKKKGKKELAEALMARYRANRGI